MEENEELIDFLIAVLIESSLNDHASFNLEQFGARQQEQQMHEQLDGILSEPTKKVDSMKSQLTIRF